MKILGRHAGRGSVSIGIVAILLGQALSADELVRKPERPAAPLAIDSAPLRIDTAAHIRAIDASLRQAVVKTPPVEPEPVKVAVNDARSRG